MRIKEGSDDYRYFPEPDLVPLYISDEWKEQVRQSIPELPEERKKRYVGELGLDQYDAEVLTSTKEMSDFFEETVKHGADAKQATNWLMGDISAHMNKQQLELNDLKVTPESLAKMTKLIEEGTLSSKLAKKVITELMKQGGDPEKIVKEKGLVQISDENQLREIITEILNENEQSIVDYKNGKDRALGFLVGQVMKKTKGQANPPMVNKILKEEIDKR